MLDKLIEYFLKFPGTGPRQAKRFAYFLAGHDEEFVKNLSQEILEIKKKIKQCTECYHFYSLGSSTSKLCPLCSSLSRDKTLLMIVEKDVDLENIERAGVYNGRYFVLGGTLALVGDDKNSSLRFKELYNKINKNSPAGEPEEIILALSANVEGENTGRYIEKILEPLSASLRIKISKLGRGLSTGAELEYSDSETIKNALESRK